MRIYTLNNGDAQSPRNVFACESILMTDNAYTPTVDLDGRAASRTRRARSSFRLGLSGCGGGLESISASRRLMRAYVDAGGDPASVPFGRFVHVSETDASARKELWPTN